MKGDIIIKGTVTVTETDNFLEESEKFDHYIRKHIIAIPKTKGEVIVSFTNEATGKLTNIKIEKSLNKAADAEAIRLLQSYPHWEPNIVDGKPSSGRITIPIVFEQK